MTGIPYVIEQGANGEVSYDLYSRMLKDRIIFIRGEFNDTMADSVVAQLLFLVASDPEADINMYINSPGGSINAMFSIFDTMNYIKCDVATIGYGIVASAASFILAAGAKGKRSALPNANIMIHELSSGYEGKYKDIKNYYKNIEKLNNKLVNYYTQFTNQPADKLIEDMKLDYYMDSDEALAYGLIDKVQKPR